MNISGKNIVSLIKTYTDKVENDKAGGKGAEKATDSKTGKTDEVRLSEFSRDIQKIQAGLDKVKDVREEKVKELKEKIESGSYDVSGRDIAEKMIQRIIDLSA